MDKHEVAAVLDEIGTLLALQGENPFRVRAYHNAARAIENLHEDLYAVMECGELSEIPGIGEGIAEKLTILLKKGRLPYFEKLKRSMPKGLLDLLAIPGLGSKRVKLLYEKLKIKNVKDLIAACKKGKVAKLKGLGEKVQQNILSGVEKIEVFGKRMLWWQAANIARPLLKKVAKMAGVDQAQIAGSFRRRLETIGDIDIVIASKRAQSVINAFANMPEVEKVLAKGPTKLSVQLKEKLQVDLRLVTKEEYGFALLYFTGSKEHNIEFRKKTIAAGYSMSEYGLEPIKGKKQKALGRTPLLTEEQIYKAFGYSYIPPELRENMGEFDAAARAKIPTLVVEKDIRGVFHCHTTDSDGHNNLEEMAKEAANYGWEYLGVSDHSISSFQANGMDEKRLMAQVKQIEKLNKSRKYKIHLFAGIECDIDVRGKLDYPDRVLKELDFVIVSVHRSFQLEEKEMTKRLIKAIENPYTTMVGHLTGRLLLKRDPYKVHIGKVIDACIANGKVMELNAHPMRLDMDWRYWRDAASKGLKCSINLDAHSTYDLQYLECGINVARKGWLEKKDIVNTLPLKQMQKFLAKR
jgi:DNA polymerase (family 10)